MKFDDKYPDAKYPEQYGDMLCGEITLPCWNCGTLTRWYELNYETPLCSEECLAQKDKEYHNAHRGYISTSRTNPGRLKTRLFDLEKDISLADIAALLGISISQIYRIKHNERRIGEKFIIGALGAFPKYKFDDLFYIEQM